MARRQRLAHGGPAGAVARHAGEQQQRWSFPVPVVVQRRVRYLDEGHRRSARGSTDVKGDEHRV